MHEIKIFRCRQNNAPKWWGCLLFFQVIATFSCIETCTNNGTQKGELAFSHKIRKYYLGSVTALVRDWSDDALILLIFYDIHEISLIFGEKIAINHKYKFCEFKGNAQTTCSCVHPISHSHPWLYSYTFWIHEAFECSSVHCSRIDSIWNSVHMKCRVKINF